MQQQIPDALIKDLSKADVVAVLRDLFEVEESDFMDHPSFRDADSVDPAVFPDHEKHALVTALVEQGAVFSAEMMTWLRPLSIIPTDVFDLTLLWGLHPEYELRILASRVRYCGRTGELLFFLAPFTRARLQSTATFRGGSPELDEVRAAIYQELLRSGCPLGNDLQVPVEPAAPLTLPEAIAALQPATPSCPFTTLASSPAALAIKSAQAVLEHDVTPHGSASNEELRAKLQHLAQENLKDKIVQASVAMFPFKDSSVFYSPAQERSYNENMSACQVLQTLLASPHLDREAVIKELQRLQSQLAQQAATILLTAEHGFVAGNKFMQEVAAASDVTYLAAYTPQVERAVAAQKSANAEAAAQAAKRQRAARTRGGYQSDDAGGDSPEVGANAHSASAKRWVGWTTDAPDTEQTTREWQPGWSAESAQNAWQAGANQPARDSGRGEAGGKGKGFARGSYGQGGGYAFGYKGGGKR